MKKVFISVFFVFFLLMTSIFSQTSSNNSLQVPQNLGVDSSKIYYGIKVDPNNYKLGVGDYLRIYITGLGDELIYYDLVVSPTGAINLPLVGVIKVLGLTLTEATKEISKNLSKYYPRASISLDLIYPRKIKVYILGEVMTPGAQFVPALSTLDDLIKTAGGLRASASKRNIQINREGKIIIVDYLKYLKFGYINENPYLEDGDSVFVPTVQKSVKVLGQVNEPGMYEIKEGEKLKDILSLAGGITHRADPFGVYVERVNNGVKEVINVDLFKVIFQNDDKENIVLKNGDVINVPLKIDRIYVAGYVQNPQSFIVGDISQGSLTSSTYTSTFEAKVHENIKVSEIIKMAGGVLPNGSVRRIQVIRDNKVVKEVDLFKVFTFGDVSENITLIPGDIVYVPLAEKTVRILGEVKDPGIYEIKPGEKIKDLIEMAGGFTVRADLKNITIERYITEKKEVIYLDLSKLYKDKDESVNINLEDGDVINIPVRSE